MFFLLHRLAKNLVERTIKTPSPFVPTPTTMPADTTAAVPAQKVLPAQAERAGAAAKGAIRPSALKMGFISNRGHQVSIKASSPCLR